MVTVPSVDGRWVSPRNVRGLVRLVQVSPSSSVIDLTIRGVSPGDYRITIRAFGDLSRGANSTGPVWTVNGEAKGDLGTVTIGYDGKGSLFMDKKIQIWEVIGHAFVVTKQNEPTDQDNSLANDDDTVVGVIARSAGVWDNDKTVCSCTGKTLWEERSEEKQKGML